MKQHNIDTARGAVVVRPTREADAEQYRTLRLEGLQRHPEAFSADYAESAALPMAYWVERARNGADTPAGVMYVAEADGVLVGMTAIYRGDSAKTRHAAGIVSVYVQQAWRGLHIADALINACLDWGRANDVRVARLGVTTTNTSAIRCYARCGFSVYGVEHEAIYANDVYYDELLMQRRL